MEIVVEWLGIHRDKGIWTSFRQHWSQLFPSIPDRSQFVRQSANLWRVKQMMQQELVEQWGAKRTGLHMWMAFR